MSDETNETEPRDTGDLAAVPAEERLDVDDALETADNGLGEDGADDVDDVEDGEVVDLDTKEEVSADELVNDAGGDESA